METLESSAECPLNLVLYISSELSRQGLLLDPLLCACYVKNVRVCVLKESVPRMEDNGEEDGQERLNKSSKKVKLDPGDAGLVAVQSSGVKKFQEIIAKVAGKKVNCPLLLGITDPVASFVSSDILQIIEIPWLKDVALFTSPNLKQTKNKNLD